VVAYLALFFALGGSAYAAFVVSSNSQIGPDTIYGASKPASANDNIVAGSIAGTDLAPGSVGTGKVIDNGLTGTDIDESSLGKVPSATTSGDGIAVKTVSDPVTNDKGTLTTSQEFQTLPGATTTINVPAGGARIVARFTGESECIFSDSAGTCAVRILLDPPGNTPLVDMPPGSGVFDQVDTGGPTGGIPVHRARSLAADRSISVTTAGTYGVSLQFRATDQNDFRLNGWHLTVERVAP
jgi:hypothetical protein